MPYLGGQIVGPATAAVLGLVAPASADFDNSAGFITLKENRIKDIVGAMVSGGTETGISVSYDGTNHRFDFVVATPSLITVATEGTDPTCFVLFTTASTGDLAPKSSTNLAFNASTGRLSVGALFINSLDGVLKAATGVVSGSATTSDLTEGSNLYFTDERAQDAVGTILTDSTTIDFTYTDGSNTITAAVIQSFGYAWTAAQTWGSNGAGVDATFFGANSGDKAFWDANGGTSSAGLFTLAGSSQLKAEGKSAFGTGTMGGTYGLSLISAGTTFNPSFAQTAACIEFAATMNTSSTFNGMYGFQMAATVSATGSSLLAEAFRAEVTAANSSGTITYLTGHDVFVNKSASGGTVTHGAAYMASAPSSAGGTFTNYYVLFVPAVPSASTNNWNIWLKGGNSRFGDDSAKTYWGDADDAYITYDGTDLVANPRAVGSGAFCIGTGAAGVDYQLKVNGETTDGLITWMEDEDWWQFEDDVHFTEAASFAANSPSQITSNQNNYNFGGTGFVRLSTDASRDITGFANGRNGRLLFIQNVGSQNIVLKNQDANSTDINRMIFAAGADKTLAAAASVTLIYDATTQRWREQV